jgi:5-methylcytosine-specific restriction endonuclease McrA
VDHKKPKAQGGTDADENLWVLCGEHHSRKTATTDGGFGNPRG